MPQAKHEIQLIEGIPEVLEGQSYYAHVDIPVPDLNEKQNPGAGKYGWEINLTVSDEVYKQFKAAGFNVGLKAAGEKSYTEDCVMTFYRWRESTDGTPNKAPVVIGPEGKPWGDMIPNGSTVKVQWSKRRYAAGRYLRGIVEAVQVVEIAEVSDHSQNVRIVL